MKQYTQKQFLDIMNQYNTMDRKIIKQNLRNIKEKYGFQNLNIHERLGLNIARINGWFNYANPTIPTFSDMLLLANTFEFSIEEVIKQDEILLEIS